MTTEDMELIQDWLARRLAGSLSDAATELGLKKKDARLLLDKLVESGAAERLRPVGCRHSRYDYYISLERSSAPKSEERLISLKRLTGSLRGCRLNSSFLPGKAATWLTTALLLIILSACANAGDAADPANSLKTLDGLVGRWMELRTTISQEKNEWQERRCQWEKEIALLEKEADTLKKELDEGDAFASSVEKRRAEALAGKERMESELRKLGSVLDRAESDLRRWKTRIPPGLMQSIAAGFNALPATQEEADKLTLVKRAQTIAALYNQLETIQNQFHATSETLEADGNRRQVDVLYVGLARAFAVSPGNDWAATGVPSDKGWNWTVSEKDAAFVRRAIDVLNRRETARLVALPMQVAGEVVP